MSYEETVKQVVSILKDKGETDCGIAQFFINSSIDGKSLLDAFKAKEYDLIIRAAKQWNEQGA